MQAALSVVYPVLCAGVALAACRRTAFLGSAAPGWRLLCIALWCSLAAGCITLGLLRAGTLAAYCTALTVVTAAIAGLLPMLPPVGVLPWAVIPVFVAVALAYASSRLRDERLRLAATSARSWATAVLTLPLFGLYLLGLLRNESLLGMDVCMAVFIGMVAFSFLVASRNLWTPEWRRYCVFVMVATFVIRAALDLTRGEMPIVVLLTLVLACGTVVALIRLMARVQERHEESGREPPNRP